MRTKMIICVMLTLLILLALSGLAAAQSVESPTYVPPPGPPTDVVTPPPTAPPTDGERIPTPSTSGGMAVGYNALIGLLLLGSALPLLRK